MNTKLNSKGWTTIIQGESGGFTVRKFIVGFVLCGVLFLSGCTVGSTMDEELSKVLSEMDGAEEGYRNGQSELSNLEQSEQLLFNDMMKLTQEEEEKLKEKVGELENLLEQRLVHIDEEEASMKNAMASIKSLDHIVGKVAEDTKGEVEQLRNAVDDRYSLHSTFVEAYKELIERQRALYELIVEETDLKTLKRQVNHVNEQNEVVKSAIKDFNKTTILVNQLKEETLSLLKKSSDE